MIRLLKIELKKITYNKPFLILMGIYAIALAFMFWGVQTFINEAVTETGKKVPIPVTKLSLYQFPHIWHNFTYVATGIKTILAFIIIILITNEHSFRTTRQNIITGLSRSEFLVSKLIIVALLAIGSAVFVFINGVILGLLNTENLTFGLIFQNTYFLFAYILELYAFMTLALFFGFLIKKTGFALAIFVIYYTIIESILNYELLPKGWGEYLPFRSISNLIAPPNSSIMKLVGVNFREHIDLWYTLTVVGYIILFSFLMYVILRKRDL